MHLFTVLVSTNEIIALLVNPALPPSSLCPDCHSATCTIEHNSIEQSLGLHKMTYSRQSQATQCAKK